MNFVLKFLKVVRSRKIGNLVNNLLSNRYFRVFYGGWSSMYMMLNNGFAQGGASSTGFFNLYISDMPTTSSRKFPFADGLDMATQTETFDEGEEILSEDVSTMYDYYKEWRLYLNEQ